MLFLKSKGDVVSDQLLLEIGQIKGLVKGQSKDIEQLKESVTGLVEVVAGQQARVAAFWENGPGKTWDEDIRANTKAIETLNNKLATLESEGKVSRARVAGLLFGAGAHRSVHLAALP